MPKLYLTLLVMVCFVVCSYSQTCPTTHLTLSTQNQIDNFSSDYNSCTHHSFNLTIQESASGNITNLNGLSQLESIQGNFTIILNSALSNLSGLNNLQSVGGSFTIFWNDALVSTDDLHSLSSIGNYLHIFDNNGLTDVGGFESLNSIGSYFLLDSNISLQSVSGFENLTSTGGYLSINNNTALQSLSGLVNLNTVGGFLKIRSNSSLESLIELSNLTLVNGFIDIDKNDALISLEGLHNINPLTITDLDITDNPRLMVCEVESICNYLESGASKLISTNGCGCNTLEEIIGYCEDFCSDNGIVFTSQAEIDNFALEYPTCRRIYSDVIISESVAGNITNLNGLAQLTSIIGALRINNNTSLTNLIGLDQLRTVAGSLELNSNEGLLNLSGLEKVKLLYGSLDILNNPQLSSLSALYNLKEIDGFLRVSNNDALLSLDGLDNIAYTSIENLILESSSSLSACDVRSVCDYVNTGGDANIIGNAVGCLDITEVGNSCTKFCYVEGVVFSTQADLTAFAADYPDCTIISGDVLVSSNLGAINNLNALVQVTKIHGHLEVASNDALPSFTGLQNVSLVGGDLSVSDNNSVTNFIGFNGLQTISGSLSILGNNELLNLEGLQTLIGVEGSVSISFHPNLSEISGLEKIGFIGGSFNIEENSSFIELAGLDILTNIGGTFHVENNQNLISISGLNTLSTIGAGIKILSNSSLNDISGLSILNELGTGFIINNNDALVEFSAFDNLTSIGGNFEISSNPSLLSLPSLANVASIGGAVSISNNLSLTSLTGLETIETVDGNLSILTNPLLVDLMPLTNITSIQGSLNVEANTNLTSLEGLGNIDPATISGLSIANNSSLSDCAVESICSYLEINLSPNIINNLEDCNTVEEVTIICGALPVELISFTARNVEAGIQLDWQTASEENNAGFEVQKSADGFDWEIIGWLEGKGTSNSLNTYGHLDRSPYVGDNYYRLKQIDFDGHYEFSNIVNVKGALTDVAIQVFPNPSRGDFQVTVANPNNSKMIITFFDSRGQIIWRSDLIKDELIWMKDFSLKQKEMYFLSVQIGTEVFSEKVLVVDER